MVERGRLRSAFETPSHETFQSMPCRIPLEQRHDAGDRCSGASLHVMGPELTLVADSTIPAPLVHTCFPTPLLDES